MHKIVITVEDFIQEPERGYPVRFYSEEAGGADWLSTPCESSFISKDLSIDPPIMDPSNDGPLDEKKIHEFFHKETGKSQRFKAMGEYLFKLLIPDYMADRWKKLRGQGDCRTILNIIPPRLRSLPWELACEDRRRHFLNTSKPFFRGHNLNFDWNGGQLTWPLRVLVVVGCRADDEKIRAQDEVLSLKKIFKSLGKMIDCELLYRPSKHRLKDVFDSFEPNIFHFIGHGNIENEEPILEFFDEAKGSGWMWTYDEIFNDLDGNNYLRFAFLNACRPDNYKTPLSIGEAFIDAGIPGVLEMQGEIKNDAAAVIAEGVYEAFVSGKALDVAVAAGRDRVQDLKGIDRRDWALPSLKLSVEPEKILSGKLPFSRELCDKVKKCTDFCSLNNIFVNRCEEYRKLRDGIASPEPGNHNLYVVRGDKKKGKTWLVQWSLEWYLLKQYTVSYIELNGLQSLNFLEVLRCIRDGDPGRYSMISRPLDKDAFHPFNREVNRRLGTCPAAEVNGVVTDEDAGLPLQPGSENLIEDIAKAFRASLVQSAGERPLVLVLDHFKNFSSEEFKEFLWPHLIEYIARQKLPSVRMVLIMDESEYQTFELWKNAGMFEEVVVQNFHKGDFTNLARELLYCCGMLNDKSMALIDDCQKMLDDKPSFEPSMFHLIHSITKSASQE